MPNTPPLPPRRICVAPMLDWTDRYFRYFARLISRHCWLYTEMVTTGALLRGDARRFLRFDPAEHPVALQLGGSEPDALAQAARLGEQAGFDEINLNLGCPSNRVQAGRFGACLMRESGLVAEGIAAMVATVDIPVTVKTRIGVDHDDSYEELSALVDKLSSAGCRTFIIHARKAWLKGLSPKENRRIPPLRYEIAHRLKRDFPVLELILNGGITDLDSAAAQLERVDGVMIGREAYHNPWLLADVDRRFYGDETPPPERRRIIQRLLPFIESELASGVPLQRISRHILGLFQGQPGARRWRRHLSENSHKKNADITVIVEALRQARPDEATTY